MAGAEEPPSDPRLRHRGIIESQPKVEASLCKTTRRELKSRYYEDRPHPFSDHRRSFESRTRRR